MKNNQRAFTLVEVMIVIAILALLAALAIPNAIRAKVNANDTAAQATLKTISTAMENYMADNDQYPPDTAALTAASPPYLNTDYCDGSTYNGFTFSSSILSYTYSVTAWPLGENYGSSSFTITNSGVITAND